MRPGYRLRETRQPELRTPGVPDHRSKGDPQPTEVHAADHAAHAAGSQEAARTGIPFLRLPGSEDQLVDDHDGSEGVPPRPIVPHAGGDVADGVDDVPIAVGADAAVEALGGQPDQRPVDVEDQTEPVERLLHVRASL